MFKTSYNIVRGLCVSWISTTTAIEQVIEKIMMPPEDPSEYIINQPIGQMIFRQGRYFGDEFLQIQSAIIWHNFLAKRYSYSVDFLFSAIIGLIANFVPMLMVSYFALSMGYISNSLFIQQITFSTHLFNHKQYYYNSQCLGAHSCVLTGIAYYLCDLKRINKFKCFVLIGVFSFLIRSIVIVIIHLKFNLLNDELRNYYDKYDFTQLYIYAFGFALGELLNTYQIQIKQLYNTKIKRKFQTIKQQNMSTVIGLSLLGMMIYVYVDSSAKFNKNVGLLLFWRLLRPVYTILVLITQFIFQLQDDVDDFTIDKDYTGKFQVPGHNSELMIYLMFEPLNTVVLHLVGNTIIGPYNSKIFIFLCVGMVTLQRVLGQFFFKLVDWFPQSCFKVCFQYFDQLKRKQISQLIKDAIYTDY
ncbi:Conserved_hypothetical protein [Hexamita inflata]|uniref:Uncharacterized protein n=1 Tax=Hexamita inflata TaxID=28002 RepID=A0ABP1H8M4_9EUKA